MANFPPNPEDGELCLPSDVFQEIVSATNSHQSFIDCTAAHVHVEAKISATRSLPDIVPNFEVLLSFLLSFFSNSFVSLSQPQFVVVI
jgi:hypothetical protein